MTNVHVHSRNRGVQQKTQFYIIMIPWRQAPLHHNHTHTSSHSCPLLLHKAWDGVVLCHQLKLPRNSLSVVNIMIWCLSASVIYMMSLESMQIPRGWPNWWGCFPPLPMLVRYCPSSWCELEHLTFRRIGDIHHTSGVNGYITQTCAVVTTKGVGGVEIRVKYMNIVSLTINGIYFSTLVHS